MAKLTVKIPDHEYDVHIGDQAYDLLATAYGDRLQKADQIGIIADEKAAGLHLDKLKTAIQTVGVKPFVKIVPAGEACKTPAVFFDCHSFLLQNHFTRNSLLIAFGGGACGDLTGFVAATFMRGIAYIQCPTTILAHDSAVGGKTAINMPEGKNMVGSFHQPEAVLFQTPILQTLPVREIRSGMAELLKHALISDAAWSEELLDNQQFISPSAEWLSIELMKGIQVKANIVEEDQFEQSTRKFLNFGHTFGHGVEAVCGFGGLSHGECVMIGMAYSLILSERHGLKPIGMADRLIEFAQRNGYTFNPIHQYPFRAFMDYMKKDKKSMYGQLNFVLLHEIGYPYVAAVTEEECETVFEELKKRTGACRNDS
ncbi:3-dehydroquinate synthase [Sporosarcina sp. Te-1]|uniref:3-dehydroquinate synthase n=1 Tax=Sporosarcina sp. Te-1 TaxID=2818390 RepID=UPI001A9EC993|nr:3-dehydroquinate synthase [Sporosarcina sp. Te-1]QTD42178.1 3-dehydroquinate synthase [Sporosarcina sp. Te-1]